MGGQIGVRIRGISGSEGRYNYGKWGSYNEQRGITYDKRGITYDKIVLKSRLHESDVVYYAIMTVYSANG